VTVAVINVALGCSMSYFNREALGIDIAVSLPAERITRYLDKLAEYHGYPLKIRVDNGPEFTKKNFIN
jgi:putative transposase